MSSLDREVQQLTTKFNRARYPLSLLDDEGNAVYEIPGRDSIDTIGQMPGDPFISISIVDDPDRPYRIRVLEYSRDANILREDLGDGEEQDLHFPA